LKSAAFYDILMAQTDLWNEPLKLDTKGGKRMLTLVVISGFIFGSLMGAGLMLSLVAAKGIWTEKYEKDELVKKEKKPYGLSICLVVFAIFCSAFVVFPALLCGKPSLTIALFSGFALAMLTTFATLAYHGSQGAKRCLKK